MISPDAGQQPEIRQGPTNPCQQLRKREGVAHVVVGDELECTSLVAIFSRATQHDDWSRSEPAEILDDLRPAPVPPIDSEQNDIGALAGLAAERFGHGRGLDQAIAVSPKRDSEHASAF